MDFITSHLKDVAPWAVTAVGTVLAKLLHTAIKEIRGMKETQVKADLCYEEAAERVPEIKRRYDTWAAHRTKF
jgi:hypothetical protein